MAVVTQLLVRYQGGYATVDYAAAQARWGIKRGFLQLGSVTEEEEVNRLALAVMAFLGDPLIATTIGVEPEVGGGNEPYVNYDVGDTITAPDSDGSTSAQRVISVTVVEDDQGELSYANELKSSFIVAEDALNRQLKKLLNGTLQGSTQVANNIPTGSVTHAENGDRVPTEITGSDAGGADTTLSAAINTYEDVQSLPLGPGSYLIVAKGEQDFSLGATQVTWLWQLYDGTNQLDIAKVSGIQNGCLPASLTDTVTFTGSVTVKVRVQRNNNTGTQIVRDVKITAIRVAT